MSRDLSGGEDEGGHPTSEQSLSLHLAMPDPLVLRQYDPASVPHAREPHLVGSVLREVVPEDLDL